MGFCICSTEIGESNMDLKGYRYVCTVWKIRNFSTTLILRETIVDKVSKSEGPTLAWTCEKLQI